MKINAIQSIRPNPIIDVSRVSKVFPTANGAFEALKDVSLKCRPGQLVAITGKSGSGKSTMLNVLSGIDKPTQGQVNIAGISIQSLNEGQLAKWRGRNVGIVFQFFQLIPTLTVIENVMLPMDFCNAYPKKQRRERALDLLDQVGIVEQADKLPSKLSGGQQQRVSIARALANDPPILMADEPTGNLDSKNGEAVFTLLTDLAAAGKTVLVVTHEKELSRYFKEIYEMIDGRIQRIDSAEVTKEVGYATKI